MTGFWNRGLTALMVTMTAISPLISSATAHAAELAISGLIRTRDGGGLSNVSVALTGEGIEKRTVTTGSNGAFTFNQLSKGRYSVTPTRTGYTFSLPQRNVNIPITSGDSAPNGTANFTADPIVAPIQARIFGRVTNKAGEPVAGVKLYLGESGTVAAETGEDGKYVVPNLSKGRYVLTPSKAGAIFFPTSRGSEVPTKGKPQSPDAESNFVVEKVTTETYSIRGRVTRGTAGVKAAKVFVNGKAVATTDSVGRYAISKLPAGRVFLEVKKSELLFKPASKVLIFPTSGEANSPNAEVDFAQQEVAVTYAIRGRVTSGTAGVAGVGIFLGDGSVAVATTNAEGRYTISQRAAGRYVVKAKKEGATFEPVSKVVELPTQNGSTAPDGEANFVQQIVAPTTYVIRGRVTNGSTGVAGVGIFLGDGQVAVATTNAEGRYAIEELAAGRYVVKAKKEGATFEPTSKVVELPTSGASTSPNGEANFTVQVPAPSTYTIRGRVTNSNGAALPGVQLRIGDIVQATTNAEGRYAIEKLAAGTYTLSARKTGFTFAPISVTITLPATAGSGAPNAEANFASNESPKTYSVRGSAKTSSGATVSGAFIDLYTSGGTFVATATTDSKGSYNLTGVVAGTYIIYPQLEGATFAPETATIVLPVAQGEGAPNAIRNFVVTKK